MSIYRRETVVSWNLGDFWRILRYILFPKGWGEEGFPLQVLSPEQVSSPFPWREGESGTPERGMQRHPDSLGYQSLGSWWQRSVLDVRIGRPTLVPVIWFFKKEPGQSMRPA